MLPFIYSAVLIIASPLWLYYCIAIWPDTQHQNSRFINWMVYSLSANITLSASYIIISLIQTFPIALSKMLKIELAITIFLAIGSAFQSVWSILGIIYFADLAPTNDNYFWYSGLVTLITTFSIGVPMYLLAIGNFFSMIFVLKEGSIGHTWGCKIVSVS
jgi:hypothetical protein